MAITTYAELQTAVANWLDRDDLTDRIPEFIALAEANIRRKLRHTLRAHHDLTNVTGDTTLATNASPFVEEVIAISMDDGAGGTYNHPLAKLDRDEYQQLMSRNPAVRSPVEAFFVESDIVAEGAGTATTIHFYPPASAGAPISALRVEVVRKLVPLSPSNTTNTLLQLAPDIYLYAACLEAAPYLQHDERLPMWATHLEQRLRDLNLWSERKQNDGRVRAVLPRVFG